MNVQAVSRNSMAPIQARVEEAAYIRIYSESLDSPRLTSYSSHPFTCWTCLVTLSKDGSAMRTTKSSLIYDFRENLKYVLLHVVQSALSELAALAHLPRLAGTCEPVVYPFLLGFSLIAARFFK